ncbi:hypothetical protein [Rhizobium sp. CCGE 510]|uniref:hypothetical protein n=1 Tax=Rhizobium sp. CCGE 510 TaxID=1132836 RepID=UPI001F0A3341|nr:hypothetical protein [Rhizobium sp. CCGE 510]
MGVGETPLRLEEIEGIIEGTDVSEPVLDTVADRLAGILTPSTDIHASADYRRHLSGVLAKRFAPPGAARTTKGFKRDE